MYASISCALFHASLAFMHKFYIKKKVAGVCSYIKVLRVNV